MKRCDYKSAQKSPNRLLSGFTDAARLNAPFFYCVFFLLYSSSSSSSDAAAVV